MSKKKIKWKWWLFSIYHSSRILTDLYFPVDIYSMYKHLISTFWINFATPTDTESLSDPPSSLSPSLPLFPRHNSSPSCPSSALHWSHSLRWQDKQTNGQDYFTLVMLVGRTSGDFLSPPRLHLILFYFFFIWMIHLLRRSSML